LFHYPERQRSIDSQCLLDQSLDYRSANASPSQSAFYEQLSEKERVFFHEALEPTNIRAIGIIREAP
jgi:hypothetical protein